MVQQATMPQLGAQHGWAREMHLSFTVFDEEYQEMMKTTSRDLQQFLNENKHLSPEERFRIIGATMRGVGQNV